MFCFFCLVSVYVLSLDEEICECGEGAGRAGDA